MELKFRAFSERFGLSDPFTLTTEFVRASNLLIHRKELDKDDITVLQFTGEQDIKGEDIYSGYTLTNAFHEKFEVIWANGGFTLKSVNNTYTSISTAKDMVCVGTNSKNKKTKKEYI